MKFSRDGIVWNFASAPYIKQREALANAIKSMKLNNGETIHILSETGIHLKEIVTDKMRKK